jgi:hypothetical protein
VRRGRVAFASDMLESAMLGQLHQRGPDLVRIGGEDPIGLRAAIPLHAAVIDRMMGCPADCAENPIEPVSPLSAATSSRRPPTPHPARWARPADPHHYWSRKGAGRSSKGVG